MVLTEIWTLSQVLVMAIFYALIIKSPTKDEDEENPALQHDEVLLHVIGHEEREKAKELKKTAISTYMPPDEDILRQAREIR